MAQDVYTGIYPGFDKVVFKSDSFLYQNEGGIGYKGVRFPAEYSLQGITTIENNKVPFIFVSSESKIIVLKDSLICLCIIPQFVKGIEVPFFKGVISSFKSKYSLSGVFDVSASSFLVEGTKKYEASRIGDLQLEFPWIEGVNGYGIGEVVTFKVGDSTNRIGKPIGIYLFNGYLSYYHPERYTQNSRVKEVTLVSKKTGSRKTFYLEDNPRPQLLEIKAIDGYVFELYIADVYPGDEYEDTCIAGLLSLNTTWNGPVPDDY